MEELLEVYPFNLALDIFNGKSNDALSIHAFSLMRTVSNLSGAGKDLVLGHYKHGKKLEELQEELQLRDARSLMGVTLRRLQDKSEKYKAVAYRNIKETPEYMELLGDYRNLEQRIGG